MDITAPLASGPPNFAFEYEPLASDYAHANLIVWRAPLAPADPSLPDAPQRISQNVLRSLASLLRLAESDTELEVLEKYRTTIDRTTNWSRRFRTIANGISFQFRLAKRRVRRAAQNIFQ